ncbi:MAG: DUF1028 domain-containing protein [Rhodospirillales bacterium]|nr:DUF1028 domain-containing protein [Rhodospirillales bacterium]MDE2457887.1 DUF1028 domain-containing protein [Rhodospirillales bacterium]
MTFSLIARCPRSEQFAVAVTSSSPAVAARCAFARAGVGAATTQNVTDPRLGPQLLDALAAGMSAEQALANVADVAACPEYRQLTVLDSQGRTAVYSGAKTLGIHGTAQVENAASAGNLLASTNVPQAVIAAFAVTNPDDELGARVIAAMQAGLNAGGEAGPLKSAGLIVVDQQAWPLADLRVDWHDEPLAELARLWSIWQPQMYDYVTRALNPQAAPSYGVPGDV